MSGYARRWDRTPFASSNPQWVIARAEHVGVSPEHVAAMRRDMWAYARELVAMGYRPDDVRYSYVHQLGGVYRGVIEGGVFRVEVTVAAYARHPAPLTR